VKPKGRKSRESVLIREPIAPEGRRTPQQFRIQVRVGGARYLAFSATQDRLTKSGLPPDPRGEKAGFFHLCFQFIFGNWNSPTFFPRLRARRATVRR
jgi:hypothetical protein